MGDKLEQVIRKSFHDHAADEGDVAAQVRQYCAEHSTPQHPQQVNLRNDTLKAYPDSEYRMLGADEVLAVNAAFIRCMAAKKILDVGVFTGASSLAAALNSPQDAEIVACETSEDYARVAKGHLKAAGVEHKMRWYIRPAVETLQVSRQ